MSGIYIPDMEMPGNCKDCLFYWEQCGVDPEAVEEGYRTERERHPDCPLIPVPDHGRLIDADALHYTRLYKDNWIKGTGIEAPAVWKEDVDSAPTIIPASEEGEE